MKNTVKSVKSLKRALVISVVAMVICVVGMILEFVMNKKLDYIGGAILCCNATIFISNYDALKKAEEDSDK